ncbi:7171_t:CDS:2, partial [Gigaspora margarita]
MVKELKVNQKRKPDHLARDCWVEGIGDENESLIDKYMKSLKGRTYDRDEAIVAIEALLDVITKLDTIKDVVNDKVVRNRMMLIVFDEIEKDLREGNSDTRT